MSYRCRSMTTVWFAVPARRRCRASATLESAWLIVSPIALVLFSRFLAVNNVCSSSCRVQRIECCVQFWFWFLFCAGAHHACGVFAVGCPSKYTVTGSLEVASSLEGAVWPSPALRYGQTVLVARPGNALCQPPEFARRHRTEPERLNCSFPTRPRGRASPLLRGRDRRPF